MGHSWSWCTILTKLKPGDLFGNIPFSLWPLSAVRFSSLISSSCKICGDQLNSEKLTLSHLQQKHKVKIERRKSYFVVEECTIVHTLGSSPQIYTVRVSVTSQKEYFFSLKICQNWNEKHKMYMPQWGKNIVVKLPPSSSWSERHWYLGHVTLTRWVFKNPLTKYFGS